MFSIFNTNKKRYTYEDTLQILFEENYNKVCKVAFAITFDRSMAEDAAQEAFLRAFSKIATLKDKSKFSSWVCSIAVNICKDMLRKKITDNKKTISIYDNDGKLKDYLFEINTLDVPDNICEHNELKKIIRDAINKLDVDTRQMIYLRYYKDLTYVEIAEYINIKEGTVKSKVHRAKQKIAKNLKKYFNRVS